MVEALVCGCVVVTLVCCTVAHLTLTTAADKLATGGNQLLAAGILAASVRCWAVGAAAI